MAIKGFKTIEDQKGYKLDSKDREIFERELKESLFGNSGTSWNIYGNTDMIEFVLYDSNDNQLPQGESGHLVRYINLDDDNIKKYFRISDDIDDIKTNGAREFLVDTEILIKEAGYSNGIFKTQITLLNRRAGSEVIPHDRLWIHEISPSRTEIRVLPVKDSKNKVLPDLQERYEVYTDEGDFRDDTISFVQKYVESININETFDAMLRLKGHVTEGQGYIDLIKKEFKIQDFGKLLLDVKTLLIVAIQHWVENKNSNVNSLEFGNPLNTIPKIQLSTEEIHKKVVYTLTDIIDKLLFKRAVLENSQLSEEDQITMDEVERLLQETTSDSIYDSTIPDSVGAQIRGCTDPNAENFNPEATIEDNSCIYSIPDDGGFVDDGIGDGTGVVGDNPGDPLIDRDIPVQTETFYIWSATGSVTYTLPDGRVTIRQRQQTWSGVEFDFQTISFIGDPRIIGDVRTYAKPRVTVVKCNDPLAVNFGEPGSCVYEIGNVDETHIVIDNIGAVGDDNITTYPIITDYRIVYLSDDRLGDLTSIDRNPIQ